MFFKASKFFIFFSILSTFLSFSVYPDEAFNVTIDAKNVSFDINPLIYGLHTARWDESLFPYPRKDMILTCDKDAIKKIKDAGITLLKYPGGNDADVYIWNSKDNLVSDMDTDEYYEFLLATGAAGFITVNFSASPELAAEWVNYCNNKKGYNIKMWEVGDEVWGKWSACHTTGENYGDKFNQFVSAMKMKDKSIKVAANLCLAPYLFEWDEKVLEKIKDSVDVITFTFYPLQSGKDEVEEKLLKSHHIYIDWFNQFKQIVKGKMPEKHNNIEYCCVGYNSVDYYPGPITKSLANALYTGLMLGTYAETKTDMACFWALHNAYPPRDGDYGILSSDGTNTPYYTYYVLKMFSEKFRGKLIKIDNPETDYANIYASLNNNDELIIIAVNKSPEKSISLVTNISNFATKEKVKVFRISEGEKYVQLTNTSIKDNKLIYDLKPYSITLFELRSKDSKPEQTNLAKNAEITASGYNQTNPHLAPISIIDEDEYTRWASPAWVSNDGTDQQWILINLKKPYSADTIQIDWGRPCEKFEALISLDKNNWVSVYENKEMENQTNISLEGKELQYLKLLLKKGAPEVSSYEIKEVKILKKE